MTDRQLAAPGFEWPIRYEDIAPYYSEVEQLLEMGGAPSNTPDVPDGEYVHSRSLHPLEQKFCNSVVNRWPLRRAVVNHVAEYEPASLSPMLKEALGTNRLYLYPNRAVAELDTDGRTNSVSGVRTVNTSNGATESFRAPIVVLAASAFESVRILLNSRSKEFPNGVGNSKGLVGTRILEHVMTSFFGQIPASLRSMEPAYNHNPFKLNAEPHGFYIPPFEHIESAKGEYRFGYGVQGTISTDTGLFYLGAFGETVPSDANRLRIVENKKDRFGIPIASIDFSWDANDLVMWERANISLVEMLDVFQQRTGIMLDRPVTSRVHNIVFAKGRGPVPGSNHECGGARMGHDPTSSVVDSYNRLWEAPNVLVCDAACFPTIPHQNPTLTTMALAVRASRHLLASQ